MRCWITGGGGFMGIHLAKYLARRNEIMSTYYPDEEKDPMERALRGELKNPAGDLKIRKCDVRDKKSVNLILSGFQPERIFHLAAQSFPTISWEDPLYTMETNVLGTVNIFEGVKRLKVPCKILNGCSSAAYGFIRPDEVPIDEGHGFRPLHPYGVSKAAQEMLAYQYFQNFGVQSVSIRIFNTTGPGKRNDVCADLTKRAVELEKKIQQGSQIVGQSILEVGNLEAKRAIMDVRDVIRAFDFALDRASAGEVYNLCGDRVYQIGEIIEMIRKLSGTQFNIVQDPKLLRTTDEPIIFGSSEKFKSATGWSQEIHLEQTLEDMLEYWRGVL